MTHLYTIIKDARWDLIDSLVLLQFLNLNSVTTVWLLCQANQHCGADVKSGAGAYLILFWKF